MQALNKLVMNSLHWFQIRKDINESCYFISETWMKREDDENILEYWKLSNGKYNIQLIKIDGLEDDNDV